MTIYTKNGDKGKTSVYSGKKLSKDDDLIWVLGTIDELNAFLGYLHTSRNKKVVKIVQAVQEDLMSMGSYFSGFPVKIDFEERTFWLEKQIDAFEKELRPLKKFIIPGGSRNSAHIHMARAICRRLERHIVSVKSKHERAGEVLVYINRLSDLLFVLARYVNFKLGIKDILWNSN